MLVASLSILSASAHIGISFPRAQAGPWTKDLTNTVHAWIGFKGKKFPCGGYKKGPVNTLRAGEVVNVRFWNFGVRDYDRFPPRSGISQGRHGGGACEFSLSYDGGKTWKVIGQYTKSCPDIYYQWPVLIPKNVPPCTDSDQCLFSMSWVAYLTNQFYHHCANIVIEGGDPKGKLPDLDMTVVDVTQLGQKMNTRAFGDRKSGKSSGPDSQEVALNKNGFFAYGGKGNSKGLNLNLQRN
ncbi:hypothetical protein BGW38_008585 [Lunasporangiospora selenospora]|uniref:Uncharacterized protein n=1 Tax=Lunasporangiospora selenospora TaxID=979761 RepID=A0A9P6FXT0_9FUNG|nr:hypothetical protein BGW38_008585 [Lunasporangiospora selenospora]